MSSSPEGSSGSTGAEGCGGARPPVGDTPPETPGPGTPRAYLSRRARWTGSFRHRDFRFLWASVLFHSLGMGMDRVALGWLVFELTDSPFLVGLSFAARQLPFFVFGIPSGAVADRVNRRIFLTAFTLASGTVAALMATVLLTDVARVWHVIALTLVTGTVWAFSQTARHAYTYDIVGPEGALNGMSLTAVGNRIGGVVGAAVAGVIIVTVGAGGQYVAVAAMLLGTRHAGQAAVRAPEPILQNLVGYVRLLRENRTLLVLMLLAANIEVFGFTHQGLLPVFAKDVLGVGAVGLGVIIAVGQSGGVAGHLVLASLGAFKRKGMLLFGAAILFGLGLMTFSLASNILLFLAVLAVVNVCAAVADTLEKTLMQSVVANEERGRAMGSWVLSIGLAPVGFVAIGELGSVLGAPLALLTFGSILASVSLAATVGLPRIRRLP